MTVSRRQFLASLGGTLLAGCGDRELELVTSFVEHYWSGIGFGIEMSAEIYEIAEYRIPELQLEPLIQRLESAFSLYSADSELSRLNRERRLPNPSRLFLDVLHQSRKLCERTQCYFQPAIHGAWTAMEKNRFSVDLLEAARMDFVEVSPDNEIQLINPLTQLSFNALVQGYLADKAADRLRQLGVQHGLLHMGETYALGSHPEGRDWKLGVKGAETPEQEMTMAGTVSLSNAGLAVSTHDHSRKLLNPFTGIIENESRVVAVVSEEGATTADAFATAFTVAPKPQWESLYQNLTAKKNAVVKIWVENRLVFEKGV